MKIDTKKIGNFIKSLNDVEYRYLELTMQFIGGLQSLVEKYKLSKEEVCERFHIAFEKYDDYVSGNFNYSLADLSCLNAAFMELEREHLKNKIDNLENDVPVKVGDEVRKK